MTRIDLIELVGLLAALALGISGLILVVAAAIACSGGAA